MAISIDDLDDEFEPGFETQQETQEEEGGNQEEPETNEENQEVTEPEEGNQEQNEEEDALTAFLKTKGISDKSKIKFENENGEQEELSWDSLSKEEQLNILKDNTDPERDLDDAEIDLINKLRESSLTPDEFIQAMKQQGASEYARSLEENQKFLIDDLTDDELYILDLQTRIEDITEEEAMAALEKAKTDESLFAKQIQGIRSEYKRIEEENNQRLALQQQNEQQEQYQQFQDSVLSEIQGLNKIGDLDIEMSVDEMNDVANFILSTDGAGVNLFSKALNDPKQLVKMAWFSLKGEEIIDNITNYFKNKIQEVSRAQYQKGLDDAKNGKPSRVVTRKPSQSSNKTNQQFTSIDDLD